VRIVAVRRDHDELTHPVVLPPRHQLVEHSVERLASEPRRPRPPTTGEGHTVRERRCYQDAQALREGDGDGFGDERVRAEGEVWTVLLEGAHRDDEAWIADELPVHLHPGHPIERV